MKLGVMFPGQGSQSVGMLAAVETLLVRETLDEAGEALAWDLGALIAGGPAEQLDQTEFTQPALLAADIAIWRSLQASDPVPVTVMAGHSLGEFAALVAAGSLRFDDALRLVQLRGRLMQGAVPAGQGGMAAVIGLSDEEVTALCDGFSDGVLEAVNFNAPGQVVVAGELAGLEYLDARGPEAGARLIKRLPVSVPSHCALMQGAADALGEALAEIEIKPPEVPVLHNLDARPRDSADAIRDALREQLFRPVRWTDTLAAMRASGAEVLAECGPGNVLCGLARRAARGMPTVPLGTANGIDNLRQMLTGGAA